MSFLSALWSFVADVVALLWFSTVGPPVNEPLDLHRVTPPEQTASTLTVDDPPPPRLSDRPEHGILVPRMFRKDADVAVEGSVNDSSFLAQLEQRTQQVKITLANLEAEKVRIEGLITELQPVVPHYDALLEAERALSSANVVIEAAQPAPAAESQREESWEQQHQPQQPAESSWG